MSIGEINIQQILFELFGGMRGRWQALYKQDKDASIY